MKRSKKAGKSAESIKEQIEKHFEKLKKEVDEKNEVLVRYHVKEIDKSLIDALEKKMKILELYENIYLLIQLIHTYFTFCAELTYCAKPNQPKAF